jgi:hypothetical protein
MPPNKPQSNYSKRPVKRVRLLKIAPRKTKGLFEEYFYGFLVATCVGVMLLGYAGGLSGYDAVVTGLWVGGFTWCAWVLRRYQKEKASPGRMEKSKQAVAKPLSPNFKPMIGPQWPLKTEPGAALPAKPGQQGKKPVFVYERPTLPDRKPKFPANWAGKQDKKPKK